MWFIPVYVIALIAFTYGGFKTAHYMQARRPGKWKATGTEKSAISLYSLILSFTMLIAGETNTSRMELIHGHADALSSLFRDSGFLPSPIRDTVRTYVVRIVEEHIAVQNKLENNPDKVDKSYGEFWRTLESMNAADPTHKADFQKMMDEVNEATSFHYRIKYSHKERTPDILMFIITVGSFAVGFLVGFLNGVSEYPNYLVPAIFVVLMATIVLVVWDFNNPGQGFIKPSYKTYAEAYVEFKSVLIRP